MLGCWFKLGKKQLNLLQKKKKKKTLVLNRSKNKIFWNQWDFALKCYLKKHLDHVQAGSCWVIIFSILMDNWPEKKSIEELILGVFVLLIFKRKKNVLSHVVFPMEKLDISIYLFILNNYCTVYVIFLASIFQSGCVQFLFYSGQTC